MMGKRRVLVAEFKHETNTFIHEKTGIKQFNERYVKTAEEVIPFFKGNKSEISAFIDVGEEENFELIPAIAANAWPGGPVTREVYNMVKDTIIESINKASDIDAVLLSLHGAMVLEDEPDGEGELLEAIREVIGEGVPIITTLDLHANITEKMVRNVNGFFPFDNNPHTDIYERGHEAAKTLAKILRKQIKPVISIKKLPILSPLLETDIEPHKSFLNMIHRWEEDPRVISTSIIAGFPYADIYESGMTIIAQTNDDISLAEHIVNQLGDAILKRHEEFIITAIPIEEAIKNAMDAPEGPIVLGDFADNVGAGAPGDGTHILQKLIEMKANNVGITLIADPETVEKAISAGVGSVVNVTLGGKTNPIAGKPVKTRAVVKTIADGKLIYKGPLFYGQQLGIGRTVLLEIDGVEAVVSERRAQPLDLEFFRRFGVEPLDKKILVVKSSVHYRAAYNAIAKKIITVDAPGVVAPNLKQLSFKNVRRPIFPLDNID